MNAWYEGATPASSPNYFQTRQGQSIRAVCMHIAQGGYAGSVSWLRNPASGVSAHFMVSKHGDITQMVSILDTAYANGLTYSGGVWIDPEGNRVKPPWPLLTPPTNPNFQTISIEHEGMSGEPWTQGMFDADVRLLRWIAQQIGIRYVVGQTLIGHRDISPIARANCPGTGIDLAKLAAAANPPGTGTSPDYEALWKAKNPNIAYVPGFGFPQRYRAEYDAGRPLGAALSPELGDIIVFQVFERGVLRLDKVSGKITVLR